MTETGTGTMAADQQPRDRSLRPIAGAAPAAARRERHPPGLYVLAATEMWERFSFYSMLAMFTLYLQDRAQGFGWTAAHATRVYSLYLACVYLSPLAGGLLADRKLGYRRAVTLGGVFFMLGHLLLAFRSPAVMVAALACLVTGNGLFKPNVSAMVGRLYPAGSHLRDRAYNLFYMCFNVGAFLAPLVAEVVKSRYGYHVAFAVAAFGMTISLSVLTAGRRFLTGADGRADETAETTSAGPSALDAVPESRRILGLLVVFAMVIVFWMAFSQNGATWTYWANDNTDWSSSKVVPAILAVLTLGLVKGGSVSGIVSNAIGPFFVLTLSLPLIGLWSLLDRRGREPRTPAKMAIGMLCVAAAFLVMYAAARAGGDAGRVSPWWLISAYATITFGELMLSPMGLSLVSKVAPPRLRGVMMGGWFVANAAGNYLVGTIGVHWTEWSHARFFLTVALLAAAVSALLFLIMRPLSRTMPGV